MIFQGRVTVLKFYPCPGVNKNTCHVKFVFRIVKFFLKIHKGRCFSVCRAAVWRLRPLLLPPCPFAMLIMPIFESARSRNPALKASYNVFRKLNLSSDRGLQYYWRSGSELKLSFLKTLYEAFKAGFLIWCGNLQFA